MASRSIARAERLNFRAATRIAAMAAALVPCLPLHAMWRVAGRKSPWPSIYLGLAGRAAGLRVRVTGQPLRQSVLLTPNHISWLDILALGGAGRSAFVSKAEVRSWGVIGWLAGLNNTVYVEREDRRAVQGQASALSSALRHGKPVALFPEGTTGNGFAMLPFRASLFAAVSPPPEGVRVQPVALDYGAIAPEIAWTDSESAGANAVRILNRKGSIALIIHFLDPLEHENLGDRKRIAAESHARVHAKLNASFTPNAASHIALGK